MPHPILLRHHHRHCFIATAAYGSALAPEVEVLQQFRGVYLMPSRWGRRFVRLYYRWSPPLAKIIAGHDVLRRVARMILKPMITMARRALQRRSV